MVIFLKLFCFLFSSPEKKIKLALIKTKYLLLGPVTGLPIGILFYCKSKQQD